MKILAIAALSIVLAGCHSSPRAAEKRTGAARRSDVRHRALYPYLVVPGGIETAAEAQKAASDDPLVAEHYRDVRLDALESVALHREASVYVSYRKNGKIYWTRKRVRLQAGEKLLSNGPDLIRQRCGNRVSFEPREPVAEPEEGEPVSEVFNTPLPASGLVPDEALPPLAWNLFPTIPAVAAPAFSEGPGPMASREQTVGTAASAAPPPAGGGGAAPAVPPPSEPLPAFPVPGTPAAPLLLAGSAAGTQLTIILQAAGGSTAANPAIVQVPMWTAGTGSGPGGWTPPGYPAPSRTETGNFTPSGGLPGGGPVAPGWTGGPGSPGHWPNPPAGGNGPTPPGGTSYSPPDGPTPGPHSTPPWQPPISSVPEPGSLPLAALGLAAAALVRRVLQRSSTSGTAFRER